MLSCYFVEVSGILCVNVFYFIIASDISDNSHLSAEFEEFLIGPENLNSMPVNECVLYGQ